MTTLEVRTWDRLAGTYEGAVRLFARSYPRVQELLRDDLAEREVVLEVAAGTGQFTLTLAETATRLIASDISGEMVNRLNRKLDAHGVSNVETAVMSAYDLELEDGSIDGVFCANALHVMETPQRALGEFHRVLRPGGRLVGPTFCHGVDRRRLVLSRLLSLVSPFVAHTRFSPESLAHMVAKAGFATRPALLLQESSPSPTSSGIRPSDLPFENLRHESIGCDP